MIRGSRGIEEAILKHLGVKRNGQCYMEIFPTLFVNSSNIPIVEAFLFWDFASSCMQK